MLQQSASAYKNKGGDPSRRGEKYPSTAASVASGPSIGGGATIRLKQRNNSMNLGGSANQRAKFKMTQKFNANKF